MSKLNLPVPEHLALSGRVKDGLRDPENRLPVSCTVIAVEDSMEGYGGIEDSWLFTSKALRFAAGVAIDLSKLRPKGSVNAKGLVASGVLSFARLYSLINEVLRRGGVFRNGAITLFLDYDHPDIFDFLRATQDDLPWAKRSVYIDEGVLDHPCLEELMLAVGKGAVWLAKYSYDKKGGRLYSNVCQEILIKSRGTCLLSAVNLGSIRELWQIVEALREGVYFLCELQRDSGVENSGIYLNPKEDMQVGLGVIGLANLLALEKVPYSDFVQALEYVENISESDIFFSTAREIDKICKDFHHYRAAEIAFYLNKGYLRAAEVAKSYGMERAFTVAPTATMSFKYRDREGYTTAPEISPVNAPRTRMVDRVSSEFGTQSYEYHPDTEICRDTPWDIQWRLLNAWQRMMERTGLAHAISADIWDKCPIDRKFMVDFLASDLKTTYYRRITDQDNLRKSHVITPEDMAPPDEPVACEMSEDAQYCEACGG